MTKKILKIKWQRLIVQDQTCPRCSSTEFEIDKAVKILKQVLSPLDIEVILDKEEIPQFNFSQDPLESNRLWINDIPLERYIDGQVGQSPCCDVCGPNDCRTVEVEGEIFETIPSRLIIKAGLIAASELV